MKVERNVYCFVLLFFLTLPLYAQDLIKDDQKVIKILIFENEAKVKTKMVSEGAMLKYRLRGNPKVLHKGKLEDVREGVMIIDGEEIAFADCLMIAGRVSSQEQLLGGIGIGMGTSGILFGSAMMVSFNLPVVGVVVAGCAALIGVGIYFVMKYKKFHLDKGWEVHSGTLQHSLVN